MRHYGAHPFPVCAPLANILYSSGCPPMCLSPAWLGRSRGYAGHPSAVSLHSLLRASLNPLNSLGSSVPQSLAGAGLQFQLPPFYTWSGHPDLICEPIEAYLRCLKPTRTVQPGNGNSTLPWIPAGFAGETPLVMSLRLFPDASVAHLTRPVFVDAGPTAGASDRHPSARNARSRRGKQIPPAHHLALDAFTQADNPWGIGVSPQSTFTQARIGLEAILSRFAARLPLVLVIPTRLLVSQKFCEDLFTLLGSFKDCGAVSVALELPPTRILHEPLPYARPQRAREPWELYWCRLPTLCTPWGVLLRTRSCGPILREKLTPHTLMPVHILFPWLVQEGFLTDVETGLVVDTITPPSGPAWACAEREGPDYFLAHDFGAPLPANGKAWPDSGMRDQRSAGAPATATVSRTSPQTPRAMHPFEIGKTDLHAVEKVLLQAQKDRRQNAKSSNQGLARVSEAAFLGSDSGTGADSVLLGAPPDSIRSLILDSILSDPPKMGEPTSSLPSDSHLTKVLAQVGNSVKESYKMDEKVSGSESKSSTDGEALSLHNLLYESNGKNDVESLWMQMEWELQRDRRSNDQKSSEIQPETHNPGDNGEASPTNFYGEGYWRCLGQLQVLLNHPTTVWSMPTLHSRQAQAWERESRTRGVFSPSRGKSGDATSTKTTNSAADGPFFIPVVPPLLSSVELEGQRRLRDGPYSQLRPSAEATDELLESGVSAHEGEGANTANHVRWLPPSLESSLSATLEGLPMEYRRASLARVFGDHRRAQQGVSAEPSDAICAGVDGADFSGSRDGFSAEGGLRDESEAFPAVGGSIVRIRRRTARRPFWYADPELLAAGEVESGSDVRNAEAAFRAGVMTDEFMRMKGAFCGRSRLAGAGGVPDTTAIPHQDSTREKSGVPLHDNPQKPHDLSRSGVMVLDVPLPGLSAQNLAASWHALCE